MLEKIKDITIKAGATLLEADKTDYKTSAKEGRGEYVTQWDLKVQGILKESLLSLCPGAGFLGEEGAQTPPELEYGYCFIVDPIDGTYNFIRGFRHSAISVALSYKKEIRYGVVYNPYQNEIFYAEKGAGAFCNGKPICVAANPLKKSLVIFGTSSYDRRFADPTFSLLRSLFDSAEDLRSVGSAALDISYIASGRADVFFEFQLCPWDYAAASLILSEAGGVTETLAGNAPLLTGESSIIASTPQLLEEIKSLRLIGTKA